MCGFYLLPVLSWCRRASAFATSCSRTSLLLSFVALGACSRQDNESMVDAAATIPAEVETTAKIEVENHVRGIDAAIARWREDNRGLPLKEPSFAPTPVATPTRRGEALIRWSLVHNCGLDPVPAVRVVGRRIEFTVRFTGTERSDCGRDATSWRADIKGLESGRYRVLGESYDAMIDVP